jgi:hypothetical protein
MRVAVDEHRPARVEGGLPRGGIADDLFRDRFRAGPPDSSHAEATYSPGQWGLMERQSPYRCSSGNVGPTCCTRAGQCDRCEWPVANNLGIGQLNPRVAN